MTDNAVFDEIVQLVRENLEGYNIPGAAVGVLHRGREYAEGVGVTSIENPLQVDVNTLFQAGSITKTFVASAMMRLMEQGELDLDFPVKRYVPELHLKDAVVADKVTSRHLLQHTGGWTGDYFNDFGSGEDALPRMVEQMAELDQLTPLGEIWSYNNSGFYLAGKVIENITGMCFETAMQRLIFEPLGLGMTFFFPGDLLTYRFAVGHNHEEGAVSVARPWAVPRASAPAGGIVCSIMDLLRYARFQMNELPGARVLSGESLQCMHTPAVKAAGAACFGIGWFIEEIDGKIFIEHGGATNGQIAKLFISPELGFAVAVLTNCNEGTRLCRDVVRKALHGYVGISRKTPDLIMMPRQNLDNYIGTFDAAMSTCSVAISNHSDEGQITLNIQQKGGFPTPDSPPMPSPPPVKAGFYEENRFMVVDEPLKGNRGEFIAEADGQISWLRLSGRIHRRSCG